MNADQPADDPHYDGLDDENVLQDASDIGEPQDDTARERKNARIDEYEMAALKKYDPLAACLGSLTADLMHISSALGDAIKTTLAAGPNDLESVRRIAAALNDQLRVTRQIERFAQLEVRAAETRQRLLATRGPLGCPPSELWGMPKAFNTGLADDHTDSPLQPQHPTSDSTAPQKPK